MRIRTQFIVTLLLFGLVLAGISASAIITNVYIDRANEQNRLAQGIARGAGELSYLTNDYMMYPESLRLERWKTRFAGFSTDVGRLQVDRLDQEALVRMIQANAQRLEDVFDNVVFAVKRSSQNQGDTATLPVVRVSWSRLAVQSQELVSEATSLSRLLANQVDRLQRVNEIIVIALIGGFMAYFLMNFWMIQRRMLGAIARLQAGTAVIGSGDLDFRIEERRRDEIGDLAHAINRMTADLKVATGEVQAERRRLRELNETLEQRVATRTAELRASEARYHGLFSSMAEGFGLQEIILDADGRPSDYRFLALNDSFGRLTGIAPEQAVGKTVKDMLPAVEPYWIERYGRVALTGEPVHFEAYSADLGRHYSVSA